MQRRALGRALLTVTMVVAVGGVAPATASPTRSVAARTSTRDLPAGTPAGCSFADEGTGTYAKTLCWIDLSSYNASLASQPQGQAMTITLPGGYTITFALHVSGGPVVPQSFPTFAGAYLGNRGFYTGVGGRPALYQSARGATTTATLDHIVVTGPAGAPETGYAFVGADAEATDKDESITWQANTPLRLISPIGNACDSGSGLTGLGTKSVQCAATVSNTKTGTPILSAQAPTAIAQTMVGGGRQGVAFGVLVSTIQLSKTMVDRVDPSDAAEITIQSSSGAVVATANTGTASGTTTGLVTVLTSDVGSIFTLSDALTSGIPSNYGEEWSCLRNGSPDPGLPRGDVGSSVSVTVGIGDFVDCAITNTGKPRSIALRKFATPTDANGDGITDAGDSIGYTFAVSNSGVLPLSNVAVSDPAIGAVTCPQPTLASGASEICTAAVAYTITPADETAGRVHNTASASGIPPGTTVSTISAPSSTTTPVETPAPGVSLVKTGNASGGDTGPLEIGETITYSYLVTNTGNVRLTSVSVDDPKNGAVTCPAIPPPGLAVGDSVSCTADATYTVTAGDVAAGYVKDTATATGVGGTGGTSPPSAPSTVIIETEPPAPRVSISKQGVVSPAADQDAAKLGDTIAYVYLVTNIGNVNLTSVAVDDPTIGSVTCPTPAPPGLAPGESVTCTADTPHTVDQTDIDAGEVTDTATATGVGEAGGTSPPSDPSTLTIPAADVTPAVSIVKTGTVDPAIDQNGVRIGDTISYSYRVVNTGDVTIQSVSVTDPALGPVTCPTRAPPGLAVGDAVTCTADNAYTVTQDDVDVGHVTDTAYAVGRGVRGGFSDPSDPSTVTIPAQAVVSLSLQKLGAVTPAQNQSGAVVGDTIGYLYQVTNTGSVRLTTVTIDDASIGAVTCPPIPPPGLAPLNAIVCTADAPYTVTQGDVNAGQVVDTATATGETAGAGSAASDPSTVTIATVPPAPLVAVAKQGLVAPASHQQTALLGDTIAYTYLVTNIGNVSVTSVSVDDPTLGAVTCPTLHTPLDPGLAVTCTADAAHTVNAADVAAGQVVDTATATGVGTTGGTSPPSLPSTAAVPTGHSPPSPGPPHHQPGSGPRNGNGAPPVGFIGTDEGRAFLYEPSSRGAFLVIALAALSLTLVARAVRRARW